MGPTAKTSALSLGEKNRITRLRPKLLVWYQEHARDFPWRKDTATTYERICVEVLLQRTRAETVARVYPRFFSTFRDWQDIAATSISELETYFRPIGLWQRRARSIKNLAAYAAERKGIFPREQGRLEEVPGVGQYVANAIQLFQHGRPRPLLDVNMARLLERYLKPRSLADIRHDPWLQSAANWLVRGDNSVLLNWAVLDFASAICKPRTPLCGECPFRSTCNGAVVKQPRLR